MSKFKAEALDGEQTPHPPGQGSLFQGRPTHIPTPIEELKVKERELDYKKRAREDRQAERAQWSCSRGQNRSLDNCRKVPYPLAHGSAFPPRTAAQVINAITSDALRLSAPDLVTRPSEITRETSLDVDDIIDGARQLDIDREARLLSGRRVQSAHPLVSAGKHPLHELVVLCLIALILLYTALDDAHAHSPSS